ncbi:hypothetical protein EV182_006522, partial [Spiromyces aspiralis]
MMIGSKQAPELQTKIKYTIQYEDRDWPALQRYLRSRYDSDDRSLYKRQLSELVGTKWDLRQVADNSDKFQFLWRRAHKNTTDEEQKTATYLSALPDELVWTINRELYNGRDPKPFEDI